MKYNIEYGIQTLTVIGVTLLAYYQCFDSILFDCLDLRNFGYPTNMVYAFFFIMAMRIFYQIAKLWWLKRCFEITKGVVKQDPDKTYMKYIFEYEVQGKHFQNRYWGIDPEGKDPSGIFDIYYHKLRPHIAFADGFRKAKDSIIYNALIFLFLFYVTQNATLK